eukprot:3833008-Lingulodinium_polyedra.AAC.1
MFFGIDSITPGQLNENNMGVRRAHWHLARLSDVDALLQGPGKVAKARVRASKHSIKVCDEQHGASKVHDEVVA